MPNKITQSNKQTQNVKVIVNNKCCDEKKKKRKPRKQSNPSPDELDMSPPTPYLQAQPQSFGISPYPARAVTYAPSTQQISPEGVQLPIPSYFEKAYTNTERTMEDMRKAYQNELEELREAMLENAFINQAQPQPPVVMRDNPLADDQDEKPIHRDGLEDEVKRVFKNHQEAPRRSTERGNALFRLREIAEELGLSTRGATGNKLSASGLRTRILTFLRQ